MIDLNHKHITPYLSYRLKGIVGQGQIVELIGLNTLIFSVRKLFVVTDGLYPWDSSDFMPILRPKNDLTKKIHKNKSFIPASIIWDVTQEEEDNFDIYGEIPPYWKNNMNLDFSNDLSYRETKKLFEWHFDIFGLIGKGAAVDFSKIQE